MNDERKIPIDIYAAKITEKYIPLFAKHTEFIKTSKYYLYFERSGDKYREILSNTIVDDVIMSLKEAKLGKTSIVNPQPINKKKLTRVQLEQGYVTIYDIVKLYKNQKAMKRAKEKARTKVKKLGTLI